MQFILHSFEFNNIFAYGEGNVLRLDEHSVTQIIGPNGSGKSSLPGALEELLYNKNSRGVKKASVKNRKADSYSMKANFSIGSNQYTIHKVVKSATKLTLTRNGEDISGHTATQTYKKLEAELGLDFQTFSKLVYQSMKSSLDFLSATDANRKKFLVGLLGLEKYEEIESQLKEVTKQVSSKASSLEGSLDTTKKWLAKNTDVPSKESMVEVPEFNDSLMEELAAARAKQNAAADFNEKRKTALAQLSTAKRKKTLAEDKVQNLGGAPEQVDSVSTEIAEVSQELTKVSTKMDAEKASYQRFKSTSENTTCHTCGQDLDVTEAATARDAAKERWLALKPEREELQGRLDALTAQETKYKTYADYLIKSTSVAQALDAANDYLQGVMDANADFENSEEISVSDLDTQITSLNTEVRNLRKEIDRAIEQNSSAERNNAKRETLLGQLEERQAELVTLTEEYNQIAAELADLKVLTKAFGSKGLVAYKIESSIKALEETLNEYLSVLTAGQFALGFELSGAKLDVVVYDDAVQVEVASLSSGEFANVQVATLLAIRKILSTINSVEINVLFLDEVISVIDGQGRDRLIELLLEEPELNTFLVSHEYSHPLAQNLYVVKTDGMATIKKEI